MPNFNNTPVPFSPHWALEKPLSRRYSRHEGKGGTCTSFARGHKAIFKRALGTHSARQAACTGKGVNSVSSASDLSDCTSVVIEAFTVPSGKTITIKAAPGAVISQNGDITFARRQASRGIYNPKYLEAVETVGDQRVSTGP
ncbi:uncharacterized protein EI90DRAFT_1023925 [Cantharellus anzutake]|uniref:uncharacterized protein n=1 Tax=Cantharellus anzutake TaxID=1750568 RepID=UPI001904E9EA|nr:uncharacterized protein EI90DRAFT_1023925 [Cantharellus anzutake]KAF8331461.1 hypothetical protein EI90DRAFT_1023925 [Cantharellus anzutake]